MVLIVMVDYLIIFFVLIGVFIIWGVGKYSGGIVEIRFIDVFFFMVGVFI